MHYARHLSFVTLTSTHFIPGLCAKWDLAPQHRAYYAIVMLSSPYATEADQMREFIANFVVLVKLSNFEKGSCDPGGLWWYCRRTVNYY